MMDASVVSGALFVDRDVSMRANENGKERCATKRNKSNYSEGSRDPWLARESHQCKGQTQAVRPKRRTNQSALSPTIME